MHGEDCLLPMCMHTLALFLLSCCLTSFHLQYIEDAKVYIRALLNDECGRYIIDSSEANDIPWCKLKQCCLGDRMFVKPSTVCVCFRGRM